MEMDEFINSFVWDIVMMKLVGINLVVVYGGGL